LTDNGHSGQEANALKAKSGWIYCDNGTDDYKFNAIPAGYRVHNGSFPSTTAEAFWWASNELDITSVRDVYIMCNRPLVNREGSNKYLGYSVRCVRD